MMDITNKSNETVRKPLPVVHYNISRVDHQDQMMALLPL